MSVLLNYYMNYANSTWLRFYQEFFHKKKELGLTDEEFKQAFEHYLDCGVRNYKFTTTTNKVIDLDNSGEEYDYDDDLKY